MKITYFAFIAFLTAQIVTAQENKVQAHFEPGQLWKDTNGEHINAHGGGIYYERGTYYWYGEHKDKNSLAQVGIRMYSSKDLYNWKNEGIVLAVSKDPDSEITAGCVMERPKVIFNQKSGQYVMWFHLELKGQGYKAARTAVAVADGPGGPFTFLRSHRPNAGTWPLNFKEEWKTPSPKDDTYEWWTPEWEKALKEGLYVRRDFETGQMSRDMTVFVDTDGKAYHIHSSEENQTLHISELTDDYLDFTGKWARVREGGQNEAPAIFKRNGIYYMVTSGLTGWEPNAARSFRAGDIMGPWEALGNPAKGKDADITFRSQSTFVLEVNGMDDALIYMGDRWNPKDHIDGRYIWLPLHMKNGKPEIRWEASWDLGAFKDARLD